MDDKKIIALFNERSEQAVIELSNKYGKLCYKVAYNILQNELDAQECINDSYLTLWNLIPPNSPDPLQAYLLKVVRNQAMKRKRFNSTMKRDDKSNAEYEEVCETLSDNNSVENAFDAKELQALIDGFLSTLDKNTKIMFMRRFWFCDSVDNIARSFGKTNHYVNVKISRTKEKLKKYLEKEGYDL